MNAMKQKAWMEAQREIMIAESTIAKPDSVFSLGCFGAFWNSYSGSIQFSIGNRWNAASQISSYVSAAFAHSLGGGHFSGSNSGTNTACDQMLTLWNAARCSNASNNAYTNIFTLDEMSGYNRGSFPTACGSTGAWATPLNTFSTKTANQSVGAAYDDMNLFTSVTAPLSQLSNNPRCSAGIPTGVSMSSGSGSRDEVVCPNPGCTPNGNATPQCCRYSGGSFTNCS
jgi:hypothetical protein